MTTIRRRLTRSPRPPTRYSQSRPRAAGPPTASSPTPSTPAASPRGCNGTSRRSSWNYLAEAEAAGVFAYKTAEQGAATTLVAAVAPEFAHTGGHYLDDGREAYTVPDDADLFDNPYGVRQWAIDPDAARELWTVSLDLIGQSGPPNPSAP